MGNGACDGCLDDVLAEGVGNEGRADEGGGYHDFKEYGVRSKRARTARLTAGGPLIELA